MSNPDNNANGEVPVHVNENGDLSTRQKDWLAYMGLAHQEKSLPYAKTAGSARCAACGREEAAIHNHTEMSNIPGAPFLCAQCIVKFVRFGVFGLASDNPVPLLVDDDGAMHIGDFDITWEN